MPEHLHPLLIAMAAEPPFRRPQLTIALHQQMKVDVGELLASGARPELTPELTRQVLAAQARIGAAWMLLWMDDLLPDPRQVTGILAAGAEVSVAMVPPEVTGRWGSGYRGALDELLSSLEATLAEAAGRSAPTTSSMRLSGEQLAAMDAGAAKRERP